MIAGYTQARGWRARAACWATCAALFTACGNLTAGGYGDVEVYASGDAEEPAPASSFQQQSEPVGAPPAETPPRAAEVLGVLEGEVTLDLAIFARTADGVELELTPAGGAEVTLDLAGDQTPRVGRRQVPSGTFDALRVVATDVSADVLGGLLIDGLPFIGTVTVDIGTAGLDAELPVAFTVDEQGEIDLLLDVNAREWLLTLELIGPLTATVTAQAFADALEASLR